MRVAKGRAGLSSKKRAKNDNRTKFNQSNSQKQRIARARANAYPKSHDKNCRDLIVGLH